MSKNSSAKYYQKNKEWLQRKVIKIFLRKKKKGSNIMVANILSKDEKQKLVEHRKKHYRMRKNALF